ncbi:MAG: hypothetical protein NXI16_03400 [Alphaproteobacteria bacterium]|nr:hypothetical protein [Alphaproteobacteria bacterium]
MNSMPSMTPAFSDGMTGRKEPLPRTGSKPRTCMRYRWEYRFYFAISFLLFLPVILLSRLLPRSWRPFKSATRASVFGETRAAAHTVVPFIFMA